MRKKELQNIFKSNLKKISRWRFKSEEQISVLENIKLLYQSRQTVIRLFNEYSLILSENKHKTQYGEGLKKSTSKQMLQRFPIALPKVKKGNTSENLLDEIRKIIYSLCREKEIAKKVYNNIMNSIKL